jgi:hypothetical protein
MNIINILSKLLIIKYYLNQPFKNPLIINTKNNLNYYNNLDPHSIRLQLMLNTVL